MADVSILYKGSAISEFSSSLTKKVNTKGKYCEDDITVVYTKPEVPSYSVTKNLTNVTTTNDDTEVLQGNSFFADLIPTTEHQITSITVMMGGVDVTSQVFTPGTGAKSITANGTYAADVDYVLGYSSVSVNVPNSYSASDEGKVVNSGALVSQSAATYTSNATYNTTLINSVTVNVSGAYETWTGGSY